MEQKTNINNTVYSLVGKSNKVIILIVYTTTGVCIKFKVVDSGY